MAPGARNMFGTPMFEPKVFCFSLQVTISASSTNMGDIVMTPLVFPSFELSASPYGTQDSTRRKVILRVNCLND